MAGRSLFIWIPLLLCCLFNASYNRFVNTDLSGETGQTGKVDLDDILSKIPITLPEGIDPKNVNVTTITIKTCVGLEDQLAHLNSQLQDSTLQYTQLNDEAFRLRREVRTLKLQLDACSSAASTITGSYKSQLLNELQQLMGTSDRDTFLILQITELTREVNTLERNVKLGVNSTTYDALQRELQEKTAALKTKTQQLERRLPNAELILQIISLQNQIWMLEQAKAGGGGTTGPDRKILDLQIQLDHKTSQLPDKGDAVAAVLKLVSVHSKITGLQTMINFHTEQSRTTIVDYERQKKQRVDLLKRKIQQLNREEHNATLTREILILQSEMDNFHTLIEDTKTRTTSYLKELRGMLDAERIQQEYVLKQLEETEKSQGQLIMRIISMMREVRELQNGGQGGTTTSTSSATTLQNLLQAKEREYAKAQDEIKELKRRLQSQAERCSGVEERYQQVKTEYEEKIAELKRGGDTKQALILNVINLHNELRALREQISSAKNPDDIAELRRQLQEKEDELDSKTADIERLTASPKIILTIIELQDEIWELQERAANVNTSSDRVKDLQGRVDDLINQIDDQGDRNAKLMLKIISLQGQVEQLQRRLSDLQMSQNNQVVVLKNDLANKEKELQNFVNDLNEKNQTNVRLILSVTDLHNQLRHLENERHNDNATLSSAIAHLRQQLKVKIEEHVRDQAEIVALQGQLQTKDREYGFIQGEVKDLQMKLKLKSENCTGLEERYKDLKTEYQKNIAELNRRGESQAALIMSVKNLHNELRSLKEKISTTDDPDAIAELQKQLKERQEDLASKTADVERLMKNPKIILTIIQLQDEIRELQKEAANDTTYNDRVRELQQQVDGHLAGIDDTGSIKLMLQIISLQSRVEQLQRQLSQAQMLRNTEVTQLADKLTTRQDELQKYMDELKEKNQANGQLILRVTNLDNQLIDLEKQKHKESQEASVAITKLKQQLKVKTEEHTRDQARIEALENQLNETEAQCSSFEQKLKDLQHDLDAKIDELQSKSDTVTSLALKISTLSVQLEEAKRQLQNAQSDTKIKELQKIIDEKTKELAKKTEELEARSAQPKRLLQIVAIQTEIERLVNVPTKDVNYEQIKELQKHMNYLIEGVQDENNENTKLMFKILAQQDEMAQLKKQLESQAQAEQSKIEDLENELQHVRDQIKEKTELLESSDTRIANLSSQIMELHKKIKPLENEISDLKEANAENTEEIQKRLDLTKRQLKDSETLLKEADAANFNSIMEIADLRAKLKQAQKKASKAAQQNMSEMEEEIQKQQKENKKLEIANRDLKQEVEELRKCCSAANSQCHEQAIQLQQSQEDADRLQQQLNEKDARINQLLQQLQEQATDNDLQAEYTKLQKLQQQTQKRADQLQQQLNEKDSSLSQMQQKLQELQNSLDNVEDTIIHSSTMTFDPDTANPRVVLSAGNTEMTLTAIPQDVHTHPGRYTVFLAALASTGFSAGRHYWEVSVAGSNCYHLGMVSESAPRQGKMVFSPSNGFWTIVLNKQGQYKALDRRSTTIPVQIQPLTLGIMIDYKKGQVSFYDTGARAHMYTFAGQRFTDKIYPFVSLCVSDDNREAPIVLVPPGPVDWIK